MDFSDKLFNYCERGADAAFWAEPLNAVSNGAFLVVGTVALATWRRQSLENRGFFELGLIALVLVIGVGSFLFHTFATRWAAIADVAPIGVFMLAYFGYALRRFAGLSVMAVMVGIVVFVISLAYAGGIRCSGGTCLNGSIGYLPALAALLMTGGYLHRRRHPAALPMLSASGVFALSLVFRTFDRAICPYTLVMTNWHLGTHALWHLCNAIVLHLLLTATTIANKSNINQANSL